jgi:hypothetical protein
MTIPIIIHIDNEEEIQFAVKEISINMLNYSF